MSGDEKAVSLSFLLRAARERPDAPALLMSGCDLNYGELLLAVRHRAGFFKANNVSQGSLAALYTDIDREFVVSLFALWALGAVVIPINITQKPDNIRQTENVVNPDVGFFGYDYKPDVDRSFPLTAIGDSSEEVSVAPPAPTDLAIIMFTSGTSGVPKAVPMTHRAIGHNAADTAKLLRVRPDDRLFINTPPYFTSSIIHVLTMFAAGASVVVERGFIFGASILDQVEKFHCTAFGGVPVHFWRIASNFKGSPPHALRFVMNSGDHLSVSVIRKLRSLLPEVRIYCVYGLTEVAGRLCILDANDIDTKTGSVGLPLDGMTVSIRGEQGQELAPGEEGEVFVEGPCLMPGYINNPKINANVMKPYGFATGDFGYKDDDGYLFLKGRRDDIFKVGGEKVSINMIEEAIAGIEGFREFAVSPVFDERIGQTPHLFYVLEEGAEFERSKLVKHLRSVLPATHIPSAFIEVPRIPRTGSGKPMRSALSDL